MTQYLCIASLSPVQESIAQGVKPRDLWAGSFLINLQMAMYLWAVIQNDGKVAAPALDFQFCKYDQPDFKIKDIWGSLTHNTRFVFEAENDEQAKEKLNHIFNRYNNVWKDFLSEWAKFVQLKYKEELSTFVPNDLIQQITNYYQLVYTATPFLKSNIDFKALSDKSEINYHLIHSDDHKTAKEAHNDRKSWNFRHADTKNTLGKACHMMEGLSAMVFFKPHEKGIYLSGVGLLKRTVSAFLGAPEFSSRFTLNFDEKNNTGSIIDDINNIIHIDIDKSDYTEKEEKELKALVEFSAKYNDETKDASNVLLSTVLVDGDNMKKYFGEGENANSLHHNIELNKSRKLLEFSRTMIQNIREGFFDKTSPYYGFYLIYAGGDDVYGITVSKTHNNDVKEPNDDINQKENNNFKKDKDVQNDIPYCYVNDVVFEINNNFANLLNANENETDDDKKPHVSAGIIHHKTNTPLRMMYHLAYDALKDAKNKYGRNCQLDQFYSGSIVKSYAFTHQEWLSDIKKWHTTSSFSNATFYDLHVFISQIKAKEALEKKIFINDLSWSDIQQLYKINNNEMHYLIDRKVKLLGQKDTLATDFAKVAINHIVSMNVPNIKGSEIENFENSLQWIPFRKTRL